MGSIERPAVESQVVEDFARVMRAERFPGLAGTACPEAGRLNLKQDDVKNGLGQLVLTLVKLLHELLEKQALRRIEAGSLTESEIERLGLTLMRQAEEIDKLRRAFNLDEDDLNIDLGPLGKLL